MDYSGLDRVTGAAIDADAHLAQSIGDILSTPLGTRVMRRDYGSMLFALVDAPLNALTRLRIFAATAAALRRWEPRISISRVLISGGDAAGSASVVIEGTRVDRASANSFIRLSIPLRPALFV